MPLTTRELKQMPLDSLVELANQLKKEIGRRREEIENTYSEINEILVESNELKFEFYAETEDAYYKRYAAKIVATCKSYGFKREFFDINKTRTDDGGVVYSGSYIAKEGDLLELKTSPIKEYYIVKNYKLQLLCTEHDTKGVVTIKKFLDKDITKSELIKFFEIWEIEGGEDDEDEIIDVLRD